MNPPRLQLQDRFARGWRFAAAVVRRFVVDHCLLHASALTYSSLLSLVPLLAIMFSVLKGLGVQRRLEPVLLSRVALDPEATQRLLTYVDRTNVKTLGALGAVALLATAVAVLTAIERSFNHIWRVPAGRSWWRRVSDYAGVVLLTPFLLLAAVGITSSLHQQALLRWVLQAEVVGPLAVRLLGLAPYAINIAALAILYAVMPNRRPDLRGIVVGSVVAGCVWQLVQSSYVALQIGVARYNAIYGALAQLPVTLVWIYVSWVVVLAGAELAAVLELGTDHLEPADERRPTLDLALLVLLRTAEAFRAGTGGVDPVRLARELRADGGLALAAAEVLREAGVLALDAGSARYVLARDPAGIDLGRVAALFEPAPAPPGCDPRVATLLQRLAADRRAELERTTLAELLAGPAGRGAG